MEHKKSLVFLAALTAICTTSSAVSFLDDFSTDTSANYDGVDTSGSGGSFSISGGTMEISPGSSNTHSVFYDVSALFDIGETLSVDVVSLTSTPDFRLSVSTSPVGPNEFAADDGVRLKRDQTDGSFLFQAYTNSTTATDTEYHDSLSVSDGTPFTLYLTRETDNTFSAAFDAGSGLVQLNTTGGTEKEILSAGDTGNGLLYIGVEAYNQTSGASATIDNLRITAVPEAATGLLIGLSGLALLRRRR